eukprot:513508_1
METDSKHYVPIVVDYINSCQTNQTLIKFEKISFKSKSQPHRKVNPTLKGLIPKYDQTMNKYQWSIKYDNQTENTHNLTFINNNFQKIRKSNKSVITNNKQETSKKHNRILSYFIQITYVNTEYLEMQLVLTKTADRNQRFYIKEINETHDPEIIVVRKGQISAIQYIEINDKDNSYHFALYNSKSSNKSLPESNEIRMNFVKDKKQFTNYKPKCIDLSTVVQSVDHENEHANIYWSAPFESFGNISYKIIKEKTKEELIISLLPYSIPILLIPLSFKVITICTIEDKIYESDPSQIITISSVKREKQLQKLQKLQKYQSEQQYIEDKNKQQEMIKIMKPQIDDEKQEIMHIEYQHTQKEQINNLQYQLKEKNQTQRTEISTSPNKNTLNDVNDYEQKEIHSKYDGNNIDRLKVGKLSEDQLHMNKNKIPQEIYHAQHPSLHVLSLDQIVSNAKLFENESFLPVETARGKSQKRRSNDKNAKIATNPNANWKTAHVKRESVALLKLQSSISERKKVFEQKNQGNEPKQISTKFVFDGNKTTIVLRNNTKKYEYTMMTLRKKLKKVFKAKGLKGDFNLQTDQGQTITTDKDIVKYLSICKGEIKVTMQQNV